MKRIYIIGFLLLTILACTNTQKTVVDTAPKSSKPSWFFTPTMGKYKFGGIGVAGRSAKGLSGQRRIAISRAIDEIATQMGVSVKSVVQTTQDNNDSTYESYSVQTTNGDVFSARLLEIWYDEETQELYAWLVVE